MYFGASAYTMRLGVESIYKAVFESKAFYSEPEAQDLLFLLAVFIVFSVGDAFGDLVSQWVRIAVFFVNNLIHVFIFCAQCDPEGFVLYVCVFVCFTFR